MEEEKISMRNKQTDNYLKLKPLRNEKISWSVDNEQVTLEIENKGVWNTLFQKILKKPRISFVHLDEMGSFILPLIDGQRSVYDIAQLVKEHFGEQAEPLYNRLVTYMAMLENCGFVSFRKPS